MKHFFSITIIVFCCIQVHIAFAQELETETARLPKQGYAKFGTAFEYQTSAIGKEYAVPLVLGFGIADRLEFVLEPVLYTNINTIGTPSATGIGDFEVTLTYLLSKKAPPSLPLHSQVR